MVWFRLAWPVAGPGSPLLPGWGPYSGRRCPSARPAAAGRFFQVVEGAGQGAQQGGAGPQGQDRDHEGHQ